MIRKKLLLLFSIFFVLLIIAGCTPESAGIEDNDKPGENTSDNANDNNNEDPSGDNAEPSRDDIVIGIESDAVTMLANTDVNYVNDVQIRNIYDPLIERDNEGGFVPGLATEWTNIDELTWEFTLKKGVTFHNGKPFTAEDVKQNIEYILKEENNSFYRSRWTAFKEVKVLDDYKVQIITHEPLPNLLLRIADDLLIMDMEHVQNVGLEAAAKDPVGTGAFKFVEWERDQYLKLEANEDYWNGAPTIKHVTFRYIPEFSSRLAAFLSGEIDLFKNIPVDSVARVENDENSEIGMIGSSRINYVALNTFYDGPLQDKKVRQALSYAVNVDELLEGVLNGYGTKMTGPLSKINADYTETEGYEYNPDKAIELLNEAGYEPSDLTLQLDTPNGRYPMDTHVAQGIAAQLQKIGITVNVQVNEWGNHLAKIRQREMADMFILGWGPAFDAQGTIENLFTQEAPYSGFYDPEVQALIEKAIPIFDPEERQQAWADAQHRLVEEAAWIYLWQQGDLYAVRKDLNFQPRIDEKMLVHTMSWN
ncbi:glutathione ABC transporter substrate-binding protein [Bacillus carboniphilus]|uniref:Glutathione ABC transporter substrate-binding protein n=1 Tax=Bacillus carboniphilus TaxID=86663 RepID=A0ABN0VWC5_9BACI